MKDIILKISKRIFKLFEKALYVNLKLDLYLLEFFGRFYTYPFFIFALFFGHFDSSETLSDPLIIFRFFCFCASAYLIATSIIVFIVFNVKISKTYLYNLLGETFVKSKIGNPGKEQFLKYFTPLALGYTIDTMGQHLAEMDKRETAQQTLTGSLAVAEVSTDLTTSDKRAMTKQAVKDYHNDMSRPVEGPITKRLKIEALRDSWGRIFRDTK